MTNEKAIDILKGIKDGTACLMPNMPEDGEKAIDMAIRALNQPVIVPCDYAKACKEATMDKLTSAVAYYDALEELRKHGYVLVDMREVTT